MTTLKMTKYCIPRISDPQKDEKCLQTEYTVGYVSGNLKKIENMRLEDCCDHCYFTRDCIGYVKFSFP